MHPRNSLAWDAWLLGTSQTKPARSTFDTNGPSCPGRNSWPHQCSSTPGGGHTGPTKNQPANSENQSSTSDPVPSQYFRFQVDHSVHTLGGEGQGPKSVNRWEGGPHTHTKQWYVPGPIALPRSAWRQPTECKQDGRYGDGWGRV